MTEENEKSENYMGMISWHRSMGTPKLLFGTEIQSTPIILKISKASEQRNLSRNWYHENGQIIEIEMSPVQWAEFLTSGNTSGVPCTINYLYGKKMSNPNPSEITNQYDKEIEESFNEFDNSFKRVAQVIKSTLDSNKPMGKKTMEELLNIVDTLRKNTVANVKFVKNSFKEDMNEMVTKAKAEFNAYIENRVHEIGIESLKNEPVKFLENRGE